jgi:hypothetical protein
LGVCAAPLGGARPDSSRDAAASGQGDEHRDDAGVGMAAALGWKFLDDKNQPVASYPADCLRIRQIVPPDAPFACSVTGLCDVRNPLLGESGATRVFGPQKGATPGMLTSLEKALSHVFGVSVGNDVSARDWQKDDIQWWRAKGSDTFGPCGPYIVAGLDYGNLDLQVRVNGAVKMKTNTKLMVHDIPTTVSFLSRHVTLQPGDLIFTGTAGKTEAIKVGDVVEVEMQGVGVLRNKVVAGK